MARPINLRVLCSLRSPDGLYKGRVEVKLDGGEQIDLGVELRNPRDSNLDLRVRLGERDVFHLQGDENISGLSEAQQMFLFMLSQPLIDTTTHADSVDPRAAKVLVAAVAHLAQATGYAEFCSISTLVYSAGDREFEMIAGLLTTVA